jgi:hypothetical protein
MANSLALECGHIQFGDPGIYPFDWIVRCERCDKFALVVEVHDHVIGIWHPKDDGTGWVYEPAPAPVIRLRQRER